MTNEEWQKELNWIRTEMPMLVKYNPEGSDEWVRIMIRGDGPNTTEKDHYPRLQRVVVQGTAEADRVLYGVWNLKWKRGKKLGGGAMRRATEYDKERT